MKMIEFDPKTAKRSYDNSHIARYLEDAPVLEVGSGFEEDVLASGTVIAVPVGVATDGEFCWPLSLNYYVRMHDIEPPVELADKIRRLWSHFPAYTADELSEWLEDYRANVRQLA